MKTRQAPLPPTSLKRRLASTGSLAIAITILTWFPSPIPGRTSPARIPGTVARAISIRSAWLSAKAPAGSLTASAGRVRVQRDVTLRPLSMCAPIRFTAMAITWNQQGSGGGVSARIRVGQDLGHWGGVLGAEALDEGPDGDSVDARSGRTGTDLIWVGTAECSRIELALPANAEISEMRAVYLNTEGTAHGGVPPREPASSGSGWGGLLRASSAEALTRSPGIITRAKWGADERLRNCGPFYSARVKMAFVHHTANSNSYSRSQSPGLVRAIYWYHTRGLGWCDIAYNFLIDKYGRIFEGRYGGMTLPVLPGATKGFNTNSVAVSAIGNFQVARPPAALIRAFERLLAWRLDVAHVDPTAKTWMMSRGSTGNKYPPGKWVRFRTIAGHRNAGYTSCPGKYLYPKLPTIRAVVYETGLPKIFNAKQSRSKFIIGRRSVTWDATASAKMKWNLQVIDADNNVVIDWNRSGSTFSLTWDGYTREGEPAPPGIYRVVLKAWNSSGRARSARFTLTILPVPPCPSPTPSESPSPSPSESPSPSPSPCPSPSSSPSPSGSP